MHHPTVIPSARPPRLRRGASIVLGTAIGLGLVAATAAAPDGQHRLDIVNRVPKFKTFYRHATAKPLDEAARFALWRKEYGIAAVPPTPEGKTMARKLLASAWPKYPALMPKADALEKEAAAAARDDFAKLNVLFHTAGTTIHSRVLLYVGLYSGNAYTVPPMKGAPATVVMPIEGGDAKLYLAHELTHTINLQLAHVKNGYGAPIGQVIFQEGLAMRAAQKIVPGLPDKTYVQMPGAKGWFARCTAHKDAILAGIRPDLETSGPAIAQKYFFGKGNTGMHREAYCAAWFVMGHMLKSGMSFPQLVRIPEDRMVATVRAAMKTM
jgi:hypothetical protein